MLRRFLALRPWLEFDNNHTGVGLQGGVEQAVAVYHENILDSRITLENVVDVVHHHACTIERGRCRQLHIDEEETLVLVRDKAGRYQSVQGIKRDK